MSEPTTTESDKKLAEKFANKLATGIEQLSTLNGLQRATDRNFLTSLLLAAFAERDKALEELEQAKHEPCDVCGGDGKPVSGLKCICNGTGKLHVAATEMRVMIYDLEKREGKLRAALDQLRDELTLTGAQCKLIDEALLAQDPPLTAHEDATPV